MRQVFETWSIEMPVAFDETFVEEGQGYWHAFGDDRSISLSSMVIDSTDGPVRAESIVGVLPAIEGNALAALPPGVLGFAAWCDAIQPARAKRCLSGTLAVDGRLLVVTITSDDEEWVRRTWLSIRHNPVTRRFRRAKVRRGPQA